MNVSWYLVVSALVFCIGAGGVLTRRNPLVVLLCLELMLNAGNLALVAFSRMRGNVEGQVFALIVMVVAAAQVVVYAGAVMVLYVFVAAYLGAAEEPLWEPIPGQRLLAPLLAAALFVELAIAILGSGLDAIGTEGPRLPFGFGGPSQIGQALLTKFLVAFEVASYLLLIAAVGAVVLARRRGGLHSDEETRVSVRVFLMPAGTGTMAEAVEGRTGTPEHRRLEPTTAGTLSAGEQRGGADGEGGW